MSNMDRITEVAERLASLFENIKFRTEGEVLEDQDYQEMFNDVKAAYDDYLEIKSLLKSQ